MCLELTVHDLFPLFSICIVLWLYWNSMFCLILNPWDTTNRHIKMLYGRYFFTPTTSYSVELFIFKFSFMDLQCMSPKPNDMQPPVWLLLSGCTPYATSYHVHNWLRLSANIILLSFIVCFRNCSTRFNFFVLNSALVHPGTKEQYLRISVWYSPICYPY